MQRDPNQFGRKLVISEILSFLFFDEVPPLVYTNGY